MTAHCTSAICMSLCLALPAATASGRDRAGNPSPDHRHSGAAAAVDTTVRYRIHSNSQFRATVTNWGYFGTFDFALVDSAGTSPAPALESPPRSQVEYLYEAGLWIGGIVEGDTLVSTGTLGWTQAHELFPSSVEPPRYSDSLGDEEFTVLYNDTTADPLRVPEDPYSGRHRPLPVAIRQTTRLVDDSAFNAGLIIEITVTNVGTAPIRDLWLGWLVDPDIAHVDRKGGFLDDLTGYRDTVISLNGRSVPVHAAWAADNDGDPDTVTGDFGLQSTTRVSALMYLGGMPDLLGESYNWWINAVPRAYDWGPQRAPGDTNAAGGRGRPLGDAMKYRYMADGEIDYDQIFAAVNKSDDGWMPPAAPDIARDYANGYDTRFLHAAGAVTLPPGDSVTAVWALVAAPRWHTRANHFRDTFDPQNPLLYRDGLNRTLLDSTLARMKILWDSAFVPATIGPPAGLAVAAWDDSTAHLRWRPRGTERLASYRILRADDSLLHTATAIAAAPGADSLFSDSGLERLTTYYYAMQSVDRQGRAGRRSATVAVLPDRPQSPAGLSAHRGNQEITLTWELPGEADVAQHRLYRLNGTTTWTLVGETTEPTTFVDRGVDNAVVYQYRLTAVSALGSESFPTNSVLGIAFAFDGPPLLLDQTLSGPAALTDKDSVSAVWQRLLQSLGAQYHNADPTVGPMFALDLFDAHPATVIVTDGRYGLRNGCLPLLQYYTYAGGIAVLSGRDLFNAGPIAEGTVEFAPGTFAYDALGITAAYYPRILTSHPTRLNAEFIGARAVDPRFIDLRVDSARTDWGLNSALPSTGGAVGFVGYFEVDTSRAKVIYTFESRAGRYSPLHGKPVAVVSRDGRRPAAAFAFPLSYIREAEAQEALLAVLHVLGWSKRHPGDANGDGALTVADIRFLLSYLYRSRPLRDPANADANGDRRVDVLDVVTLVNHVWRGGVAPLGGCAPP